MKILSAFLLATIGLCPLASQATTYDVTTYGADPSGINDSTRAINNAISAAGAGNTVYFPGGTYLVRSTLNVSNTCTFTGDGENCSILRLVTATNLISASGTFTISDLTLTTNQSTAGTAIGLSWGQLVANRLQIKDDGGAWANGIVLQSAPNSIIKNCILAGHQIDARTVSGGNAISLTGDSSGTNVSCSWISFWNTGINVSAAQSSLVADKALMVFVYRGVYASANVGTFQFVNGHVDARGSTGDVCCINIAAGSTNATITNNHFIIGADTPGDTTQPARFNMDVAGSNLTIEGNLFRGEDTGGGVVIEDNCASPVIRDNIFQDIPNSVTTALWLQPGTSNGVVDGNSFPGCGWPCFDQGSGTLKQANDPQL